MLFTVNSIGIQIQARYRHIFEKKGRLTREFVGPRRHVLAVQGGHGKVHDPLSHVQTNKEVKLVIVKNSNPRMGRPGCLTFKKGLIICKLNLQDPQT